MFLWVQVESFQQDRVCLYIGQLVYIFQMPLHTAKCCKFFTAQRTWFLEVIRLPPFLVNLPDVSLDFLFGLKSFATGFTEGGLLTMRLHMTIEMMRISVAFAALIADMDLIVWVVGPLLMIVQGFVVLKL